MHEFQTRWSRFWFEPVAPFNLGLCRVLFFGGLVLMYLRQDFSAWSSVADVFWMPIWVFEKLRLPVLSADWISLLQDLWKVALTLSCLGLCTRISTTFSFLAGLYLLGLPHNFGKIHRYDAVVVIILAIMALAHCEHSWSIDRLIRQRTKVSPSGEYNWPVKLVWLTLALVFFGAGISKLKYGGFAWINSDNLAILLIKHNYHFAAFDPLTSWGLALAQHVWLCRLLAAATVIAEISYPLALFSSRARCVIVPVIFVMLVGVRLVMGPAFYPLMLSHVFWIPWDRVIQNLRSFSIPQPKPRRHRQNRAAAL